jgi:hypothetical protein
VVTELAESALMTNIRSTYSTKKNKIPNVIFKKLQENSGTKKNGNTQTNNIINKNKDFNKQD